MHTPATWIAALSLLLPLALVPARAEVDLEVEGRFARVTPPQPTATSGEQVEVIEMFWYGCPHCFSFEPVIKRWEEAKPDWVVFRRMPAIFRKSWEPHARAFFTAELLGVQERIHKPLFDAIHLRKESLGTREALMGFFEKHGVAPEDFKKTYDSFAVEAMVRRATVMTERYGIQGVPAMVVQGKYWTSGSLAGSLEGMLKVVDALADKEHEAASAR